MLYVSILVLALFLLWFIKWKSEVQLVSFGVSWRVKSVFDGLWRRRPLGCFGGNRWDDVTCTGRMLLPSAPAFHLTGFYGRFLGNCLPVLQERAC